MLPNVFLGNWQSLNFGNETDEFELICAKNCVNVVLVTETWFKSTKDGTLSGFLSIILHIGSTDQPEAQCIKTSLKTAPCLHLQQWLVAATWIIPRPSQRNPQQYVCIKDELMIPVNQHPMMCLHLWFVMMMYQHQQQLFMLVYIITPCTWGDNSLISHLSIFQLLFRWDIHKLSICCETAPLGKSDHTSILGSNAVSKWKTSCLLTNR